MKNHFSEFSDDKLIKNEINRLIIKIDNNKNLNLSEKFFISSILDILYDEL